MAIDSQHDQQIDIENQQDIILDVEHNEFQPESANVEEIVPLTI